MKGRGPYPSPSWLLYRCSLGDVGVGALPILGGGVGHIAVELTTCRVLDPLANGHVSLPGATVVEELDKTPEGVLGLIEGDLLDLITEGLLSAIEPGQCSLEVVRIDVLVGLDWLHGELGERCTLPRGLIPSGNPDGCPGVRPDW